MDEKGYHLRKRNKRAKIDDEGISTKDSINEKVEEDFDLLSLPVRSNFKRKSPINVLPAEILQKIFGYLSFAELAETVRLVNGRFKILAEDNLNRGLLPILRSLIRMKANIADFLEKATPDNEADRILRCLNTVENLIHNHSVIVATVWRYALKKTSYRGSMFAGRILDLYRVIINMLVSESLENLLVTRQVIKLANLTKMFCIHFDRIVEEPQNGSCFVSGAKIVDILDTAVFSEKTVVYECSYANTYTAKICYHLKNAWFLVLDVDQGKKMNWNEQQRFMYMRLRRLACAHTEMTLTQLQYDRELVVKGGDEAHCSRPWNSVYTGYGEVNNKFFFYGAMNQGAYVRKFNLRDGEDIRERLLDEREDSEGHSSELDRKKFSAPYLGLDVKVEIQCPVELAPYEFTKKNNGELDGTTKSKYYFLRENRKRAADHFFMKVEFEFSGANHARLPGRFAFVLNQTRIVNNRGDDDCSNLEAKDEEDER